MTREDKQARLVARMGRVVGDPSAPDHIKAMALQVVQMAPLVDDGAIDLAYAETEASVMGWGDDG